ncbi:hypothetical protein [Tessaracoccus palaemonis]|uniref:Transmembrane protein n=1 Tax=Tessaracoccus palaemonis TaxID=2829499 RepID=A0ABX8SIQ0_9ACTN|nr:hypothetical protein [Tessaracoccus palaemonis]QXT63173.1 hypothetical protein KDB89_01420 [Tessaracoccus palaemonis]
MTAPHSRLRTSWATLCGWVLWLAFVLLMAAGADHPLPPSFWIAPAAGLVLVAGARWILPASLELWATGRLGAALATAALTGAGCAAVVWTALAVVGGNLALAGPRAVATGYVVVMAVGALGWLAMLAVARLVERRSAR